MTCIGLMGISLIIPAKEAQHFKLEVTKNFVYINSGSFVYNQTVIERQNILHYKTTQSVFHNYMCICDLTLALKGQSQEQRIQSLDTDDAQRLIDLLFSGKI